MSFLGASVRPDQSMVGRGAVYVGGTTSSYTALPSSMYSVGAFDGSLSIATNQDIIKLNRTDLMSPYAALQVSSDVQVTFSLQEVDIFNLSLATGYYTTSEAFADITGGYDVNTSGHHGVLHSNHSKATTPSADGTGVDSLQSIATSGSGSVLTIKVNANSTILDGLDVTSGSEDWIILSGITFGGFQVFNDIPLKLSEGESSGGNETVIATSVGSSGDHGYFNFSGGTISGSTIGGAQLRRIYALDMVTFKDNSGDKTVVFKFSENSDINTFGVSGNMLTLNGTVTGTGEVSATGNPSVNLLKEINGYPLKIITVSGGEVICELNALTSHSGSTDVVYSTDNDTDEINMGYLDGVKKLVLGSDSQAEYRSVMLRVESPAMIPGGYHAAEWQFYKCKFIYDGSVEYDRLDAVRYPVTIHCLGNNDDVIGQFITPDDFQRTGYYGES